MEDRFKVGCQVRRVDQDMYFEQKTSEIDLICQN